MSLSSIFNIKWDILINRSKIVLNIHYYEQGSLETHRIEYLCSKAKCVISEYSTDSKLDEEYKNCVVFSHPENMINNIIYFLSDMLARTRFEINVYSKYFKNLQDIKAGKSYLWEGLLSAWHCSHTSRLYS